MRDISFDTAAEVTRFGWLLALYPTGLPNVFLNTAGADFAHGGNTYRADPGFAMGSGVRFTDGVDPATLDVVIPVSGTGPVTPDRVTQGLYRGAAIVVRIVDFESGAVSPPIGFLWCVGTTTITNDGKALFEARAETRVRRELILKIFEAQCPYHLGDSRCGVDMAPFIDAVAIDGVTSLYEFTVTGSGRPDGWYDNGAIQFSSGANSGRAFTVRRWTLITRQVLLWEPLRAPATIGDTASVHAGDDKSRGLSGCSKFANNARFGGFADMPPEDAIFRHEEVEQPAVVTTSTTISGGGNFREWWERLARMDND